MSRVIKFRAWDYNTNKMYYSNPNWRGNHYETLIEPDNVALRFNFSLSNYAYKNCLDEKLELMQFTGLKDKNGREIYDGDILNFHKADFGEPKIKLGVVTEHEGAYWIDGVLNDKYDGCQLSYCTSKAISNDCYEYENKCEVVGNIYQNTELLKNI